MANRQVGKSAANSELCLVFLSLAQFLALSSTTAGDHLVLKSDSLENLL
jgi:hypothetical protein